MSGLPGGWVQTELGELGDWSSGGTPSRSRPEYYDGNIPWVKTGDLNDRILLDTPEKLSVEGLKNSSAKSFPSGTLLIAMYGATIGKTALLGVAAATNQACAAFLPNGTSKEIIPFLWKYSLGCKAQFISSGQGGAQPNISQTLIKQFPIKLPPLAEQKRIVAKLDGLSAKSARARTELVRIETLVSRYKQALLGKAFSGELTAEWQSSAPIMKQGWLQKPLEQIVVDGPSNGWSPIAGGAPSGLKSLRLSATSSGKLVLDDATIKYIDVELSEDSKYWLRPDDVLIQRANSLELLGTTVLFNGPPRQFIYPDLMMRVRVDPAMVTPSFLATYLNTERARTYFRESATGTAGNMPKINGRTVRAIPVPVPPLFEQQEIVRLIETAFARIDRFAAEAKRALALVGKLDEAILAKAFRGELVPQDENDEPASVLLERIRAERAATPKPKRGRARAQGSIA